MENSKAQQEQEHYDQLLARYTKRWGERKARVVLRSFFRMEDPRIVRQRDDGRDKEGD